VQGESGLLEYYHEQRRLEADRTDQNAWTRRSELQANCLAGVFLGSVRVSYPLEDGDIDAVLADAAATADREGGPEDERTHGSADNSTRWMRHGLDRQEPGACNTWDVEDPSLVE
jgi:predicted metalloprotease